MDVLTLLLKNLDVEKLLNHYGFNRIKDNGDFIRACCKIHDGNNPSAFVINKESGLWYCHTNCGGGDIFTLVQKMENLDFPSAVRRVAKFFDIDITNMHLPTRAEMQYLQELQQFINVIKARQNYQFPAFNIDAEIKEVIKFRDFQPETLQHFSVGFVREITLKKRNNKEYTLYNRLIFPITYNNIIVGISLRRTNNKDFPKWSHQPTQLETRKLLYNYDCAKHKNPITICEGINDVMAFYEIGIPAVATFGAHFSKEQYRLLMLTGADLVLAYDADKAGESATRRAVKMLQNKVNISIVSFAENADPASIEKEVLRNSYNNKQRV